LRPTVRALTFPRYQTYLIERLKNKQVEREELEIIRSDLIHHLSYPHGTLENYKCPNVIEAIFDYYPDFFTPKEEEDIRTISFNKNRDLFAEIYTHVINNTRVNNPLNLIKLAGAALKGKEESVVDEYVIHTRGESVGQFVAIPEPKNLVFQEELNI